MDHNILYGKKWAVCGDSFSNGDFKGGTEPIFEDGPFAGPRKTYGYLIAARNGMRVQHLAAGGMTMATPSDEEFTNTFSGGLYKTIDADADYITLYFGINDSHHRPKSTGDDGEVKKGIIHLGSIKARCTEIISGALQILQQVSQGRGLPVASGFVERDVQRLLIRRVLDVHHNTVHLGDAFCLQHLEALVPADDVACHLVPDDGIYVSEVMQAAPDLFIRRIARLQVFPGVVFCRLQPVNGHGLHVQIRIHGSSFCRPSGRLF